MLHASLDIINLYQCDRGFATGERVFDFPYLLYVHKGKGVYKIGSVSYPGKMGDLFYCPAGVGNTILADEEDPFLLSGIDFRLHGAPDRPIEIAPVVSLLADTFLVAVINRMVSEFALGRVYSREICDELLTSVVLELQRISRTGHPGGENVQSAILSYLQDNISRTVTSGELAAAFSYHKSTVNRILTAATGMSLREYQIAARTRMASELLAYSNRPLGDIAALCGYGSAIFFSRQFKQKTGQTPGQYRRARQQKE